MICTISKPVFRYSPQHPSVYSGRPDRGNKRELWGDHLSGSQRGYCQHPLAACPGPTPSDPRLPLVCHPAASRAGLPSSDQRGMGGAASMGGGHVLQGRRCRPAVRYPPCHGGCTHAQMLGRRSIRAADSVTICCLQNCWQGDEGIITGLDKIHRPPRSS